MVAWALVVMADRRSNRVARVSERGCRLFMDLWLLLVWCWLQRWGFGGAARLLIVVFGVVNFNKYG